MHADEYRDYKLIRDLRIAETLSDPEHVYNQLERLAGSKSGSYIKQLEAERQDLRRRVHSAHVSLDELKDENDTLRRERELAERRLETVRNSRTFQVGKVAITPVQTAREVVRNPKASFQELAKNLKSGFIKARKCLLEEQRNLQNKKEAASAPSSPATPAQAKQGSMPAEPQAPAQQANSLAAEVSESIKNQIQPPASNSSNQRSPLERFNAKPNVKTFEKALNFLWFTKGQIQETKAFIEGHPKFVEKLDEVPKSLAVRVLGEARLLESVPLPERGEYPAYIAEPDRIMYCVHQSPVYNSNGYSTRTRGVANGMKAAGGDVVVVARSGYPWDSKADVAKPKVMRAESMLDDIQYVHVPGGNLNRDPIDRYVMQCADAFVREARMVRPSVIQAASNFRTALPALIAARRLGIPFVYEVRGLWEFTEASAKPGFEDSERFDSMRTLETIVAKNADRVLAITSQVEQELIARGVEPENITVAPNSVDPEVFVPLPKDKGYAQSKKISTDVPVLGFAGSIVGYEGLDLIVEASSLLATKGIGHQIVIAGSGAAEQQLKDQAAELGLGSQVLFLGRLPQNEMPRLQSTFDVVVCPRRANLVTQLVSPLKPLESFATGTATVLSDVAPNKDLAGDSQERALLSAADSAESLAEQLEKLIQDPELMANLGRTSRLWAVRERSWKKLGETILSSHIEASENYASKAADSKEMKSLRVGVIGDEFTRSTLEDSFDVELLSRENWREQLNRTPEFDLIFVESAWEGNEGEWHRGVGHYSDEESSALRGILALAKEKSIPTVFWNKEDPIHISRFVPNAALFDHVFTTDANMIPKYLNAPGCQNVTVSALPFYAQPKLHNPLPVERGFRKSISYAGSYYGDRYKERSKGLELLLESAAKYPMDIYDRQANNPDSPYKFPMAYRDSVRGGLPYSEVVESYSSHIAHLNVNSVLNSPTMFSRRVVEIPACGGIVMSAYSRGIAETLGSNIAHSNNSKDHRAWLHDWMTNPTGRLDEIWRQMRTVYRSHTTDSAMAIMARTAGISVKGIKPVNYIAHLNFDELESSEQRMGLIQDVAQQSIRPQAISGHGLTKDELDFACSLDIQVSTEESYEIRSEFDVYFPAEFSRTFAEDVLLPARFGDFSMVYSKPATEFELDEPVVSNIDEFVQNDYALVAESQNSVSGSAVAVVLPLNKSVSDFADELEEQSIDLNGKTVVVAGHDLKFAGAILEELENAGCEILIDKWDGHNKHDEAKSEELLSKADLVICEWGLGNAVWYSQNLSERQSMIVRVHSQELFLPFLKQIKKPKVDKFIFVGELIRKAAVASHGVPDTKAIVLPNFVDTDALNKQKSPGVEKTIGFVGMVPKSKRLDRALDVLEELLKEDSEYKLRIKGKTPEDYPWMKNRPQELEFYEEQYSRIAKINSEFPEAVCFDGFGADMDDWYSGIGIVISTSEFESFHLTIADGAASAAAPYSLNWPGADLIYPLSWLSGSTVEMADAIRNGKMNGADAKEFVTSHFQKSVQLVNFIKLLQVSMANKG